MSAQDLATAPSFPEEQVEYDRVIAFKQQMLRKAAATFLAEGAQNDLSAFAAFCQRNSAWLDDYALFMACKAVYKDAVWVDWEAPLRQRNPEALKQWREKLSPEIDFHKFAQFAFFRQWQQLRDHCQRCGIRIMGDIPIYVAHDSADVWAHPELFRLDEQGHATAVAGVPPDYFSATGQYWGNPLYRWDVSEASGHRWWIERCRASLNLFDMVRLDHFRGFEAYWEIPASDTTADKGKWVKGPGAEFFQVLQNELKELPFVAENLGVITPEVEALRTRFGFPGMSLLQFAFGNDPQGPTFRPHNYSRELVAYTGGHDNDTTVGWFHALGSGRHAPGPSAPERQAVLRYLGAPDGGDGGDHEGTDGEKIHWRMIRAIMGSVANIAIVPAQDLLGLGSEGRMNQPGTATGNWSFRLEPGALTPAVADRLRDLTELYQRRRPEA